MTFDVFTSFATDENLENNGTVFKLGKGSSLLIARAGNRTYSKTLTKMVEKHRVELDAADESAEAVSDQIMIDVMAEAILLGWEHLSFKGSDLPYTRENAKMLLGVKDFRKHVAGLSSEMDAYKFKAEAATGNA